MKTCKKHYTKVYYYLESLKKNFHWSKEILDIVDKDIDEKYLSDNNMKIFAVMINRERAKRNLLENDIHKMSGISESSVARCENVEHVHEIIKLSKTRECYVKIFALIYSVSPLYLLGVENESIDINNDVENESTDINNDLDIALFGKDLKFTDFIVNIDPLEIMYNYLSKGISYSINFESYIDMKQNIIDKLNSIFFARSKCNEKVQQIKILKDIIKIKESNIFKIERTDEEKYKYFVKSYINNRLPKTVTCTINNLELARNKDKDFYNLLAYISVLPMYLRYNILNILSFIIN